MSFSLKHFLSSSQLALPYASCLWVLWYDTFTCYRNNRASAPSKTPTHDATCVNVAAEYLPSQTKKPKREKPCELLCILPFGTRHPWKIDKIKLTIWSTRPALLKLSCDKITCSFFFIFTPGACLQISNTVCATVGRVCSWWVRESVPKVNIFACNCQCTTQDTTWLTWSRQRLCWAPFDCSRSRYTFPVLDA